MKYRIYIDTLFAMNFIMNYFLLLLVSKVIKCTATHLTLIIGAALGSGITCTLFFMPIPGILKIVLAYGVISSGMVIVALRLREVTGIFKATIYLYVFTFLVSGVLRFAFIQIPFLRKNGIYSIEIIALSYFIFLFLNHFIKKYKSREKKVLYPVCIKIGSKEEKMIGIMDTGNQLYEPISGRPVSIIEEKILHKYIEQKQLKGFCVIPFHSIGKDNGILKGYEIEEVLVHSGEAFIKKEKIVVAVLDGSVSSANQYQMILHPQLLED